MSKSESNEIVEGLVEDSSLMTAEAIEGLPRHDDLWFDDGNVVIASSDLSFRLHRGVLARHSSVFKDLFQVPQADQAQTVEGCPVAQLHDRGVDLVLLFTLLYDGIKDPIFRPNKIIEFKTLRTLIQLAYKYEIPHLQQELKGRLDARFSSTLKTWDEEASLQRLIAMRPRDVIAVVVLARAYGWDALLPVALFECTQLPKLDLIASVTYAPGDAAQLSADDIRLCLGALDPLAQRSWWVRELLLSETVWDESECVTPNECRLARQDIVRELAFSPDGTFHSTDPLARTVQLVKSVIECIGIDLCSVCREEYEAQEGASRRLVWKDLGKMFGFPDWVGL